MGYTVDSFLLKIKPFVLEDMRSSGILASLTTSQAIIESNKGNSGLTTKANNLFGIKGTYNGQSVEMLTTEYYNGIAKKVMAKFRKYPSWLDSIEDHSKLFNTASRYTNLRNCQDWEEATVNVKKDGYATSPTYATTLQNMIRKYKLWMWDYEVLKTYPVEKLRPVRTGSDGGGVYLLQSLLNEYGYGLSKDGNFGPKTESAVKEFQKLKDLEVDGIVGQKTWTELKK